MLNKILTELNNEFWIKTLLKYANVYLVGGCVRDGLIGQPLKDIDIVVEGLDLDVVKDLLKKYGKVDIVGESFSVLKFRPKGHTGQDYDIAVPRKDRKVGTGHKGIETDTKGVDINSDLKRRDFTVNSIAVNVRSGKILDPFNGIEDLKNKVLRATDTQAFAEDPLRIIRAIQFASRFSFEVDPKTLSLMKQYSHEINDISGERIKEEFDKILVKGGSTKIAFELIEKSDIDKALLGTKIPVEDIENYDKLDPVSFYYILSSYASNKPADFYRTKLKGEANMIKAIETLDQNFDEFDVSKKEHEVRWKVFLMLKKSPMLASTKVLPVRVKRIIHEMRIGKIPMKTGDIPVNGNDIMNLFDVKNEEVGKILARMYQDALMRKYDWTNKEKTIDYLESNI